MSQFFPLGGQSIGVSASASNQLISKLNSICNLNYNSVTEYIHRFSVLWVFFGQENYQSWFFFFFFFNLYKPTYIPRHPLREKQGNVEVM